MFQVGDREDSNVYIRMKVKYANECGMHAEHIKLPSSITQQKVIESTQIYNNFSIKGCYSLHSSSNVIINFFVIKF